MSAIKMFKKDLILSILERLLNIELLAIEIAIAGCFFSRMKTQKVKEVTG